MTTPIRMTVAVKPKSRTTSVTRLDDGTYRIRVTTPANDGQANKAVIKALADHLDVAASTIRLLRGHRSHIKHFVIGSTS